MLEKCRFLAYFDGRRSTYSSQARGAKSLRSSHDNAKDRLEGLLPVVEDWHARLTLAKVYYWC